MGNGLVEEIEKVDGFHSNGKTGSSFDVGSILDGAEALINSFYAVFTYVPLLRVGSIRSYADVLGKKLRATGSNGNGKISHNGKVTSSAGFAAYPAIGSPKQERHQQIRFLESRLNHAYQLSGDRYTMLTKREIFHGGESVAILDHQKMSASINYEKLPQARRAFFEMALKNAGFNFAPYSDSQSKP